MNHPCEDCRSEKCTDMCCKWREWFREKWAEIRRMYGMENRDDIVKCEEALGGG